MAKTLADIRYNAKLGEFDSELKKKGQPKALNPAAQLEKEKHMLFKQRKAGLIDEQGYVIKLKRAYERYNCLLEDFNE